jgi:hypothetical protein
VIARIQQLMTFGLLVAAVAWAWSFWHAGHRTLAIAGAVAFVFGYAVVLAAEFAFLFAFARCDTTPRASIVSLVRAWWTEVLVAPQVFCWRQPFRARAISDWLPHRPTAGRVRGVVLVHGFACNRAFWNPWMPVLRQRGIPYIAVNLEPPFCSISRYRESIASAVRTLHAATGCAPIIVAHSMGGLAVRRWLAAREPNEEVARVITIGSPHQGTWLARFGLAPNSAEMRIGSEWQRELCRHESSGPSCGAADGSASPPSHYRLFTCFYSNCDNMVVPPSHATLPGADNRHIAGCPHVDLAFHPAVLSEALHWANRVEAPA